MIAEFSIHPVNGEHISADLARVVKVLDKTGLTYRLGPMGTCVEGSWDEIMKAIGSCLKSVGNDQERVVMTIVVDERKTNPHRLGEMVDSVERHWGGRVSKVGVDVEC